MLSPPRLPCLTTSSPSSRLCLQIYEEPLADAVDVSLIGLRRGIVVHEVRCAAPSSRMCPRIGDELLAPAIRTLAWLWSEPAERGAAACDDPLVTHLREPMQLPSSSLVQPVGDR